MKWKFLIPSLALLIMTACNSDKVNTSNGSFSKNNEKKYVDMSNKAELKAEFNRVNCWINFMPGPNAKPRFNINGEITLFESNDYNLSEVELTQIDIYQNQELIYSIKPEVRIDENLSDETMKLLIFSNKSQVYLDENLNPDELVNVNFIFNQNMLMFSHIVKDIKLEKAY